MHKPSYSQILRSSSVIGGVAGITLILGMLRTKAAAIFMGAAGVGLISSMTTVQVLVGSIAGLGIQSSAVRDIAEANAKGDKDTLAKIVLSLRRISLLTGITGLMLMFLLSELISQMMFGSSKYSFDIATLGVAILLLNIQGGELALIQGTRRLGDLAKVQIISTLLGTVGAVVLYLLWGLRGIAPAIVFFSAMQLFTTIYAVKKIDIPKVKISWSESIKLSAGMVHLGFAMMWTGLLGSGVVYVINTLLSRQINVEAVGIYSAAFALSGVFVNFVLSSMGVDYLPRLAEALDDKDLINSLINEQTEVGVLMAGPGLMATIVMAPMAISIFYSSAFTQAIDLLQWFALGCFGRVVSWPMSYLLLAFKRNLLFFALETIAHLSHLSLVFICFYIFGISGVAIGFFIMYILYILATYSIASFLTNFSWTKSTKKLLLVISLILIIIFIAIRILPGISGVIVGGFLTFYGSIVSLCALVKILGEEHRFIRLWFLIPGARSICNLSIIKY